MKTWDLQGLPGGWLGLLYRAIKFPINSEAKAVLGYDLGGSRLCQGYHQGFLSQLNQMLYGVQFQCEFCGVH